MRVSDNHNSSGGPSLAVNGEKVDPTTTAAPVGDPSPPPFPKNFLVVTTQQQNNKKPSNLIRLIKRVKECLGDRIIVQFNRCKNLDLTDVPLVAPRVFRWLRLSGQRDPAKSQLMAVRLSVTSVVPKRRRVYPAGSGDLQLFKPPISAIPLYAATRPTTPKDATETCHFCWI